MRKQLEPAKTADLFGPQLPEFAKLPDQVRQQVIELLSKLLIEHNQPQPQNKEG